MKIKLLLLVLISSTINICSSLDVTTKHSAVHFKAIEQSHAEAKTKEYKLMYTPKVDPKTYMGDFGPSPRIMKYLTLVNKEGEIEPYNTDINQVKTKYLAKLKYDKVANKTKINQLTSFFTTEMARSILTYFQDLARGGLNYYQMTEPHFRQWLAIKIVAGKDIKMYARSIAEDIELFKQFYINARNRKIMQIWGIPEGPKSPMRYVPPTTNKTTPQIKSSTQIGKIINQTSTKSAENSTKSINKGTIKTNINVQPEKPGSKPASNKISKSQNVKPTVITNQQRPSPNKVKNILKTNQLAANLKNNNQILIKQTNVPKQTNLFNTENPKTSQVNNKQGKLLSYNDKNMLKNTQNSLNKKAITTKQAASLQISKKDTINTINTNKVESNKPKHGTKIAAQTNLVNKINNRQSIQAIEVKKLTQLPKKQKKKALTTAGAKEQLQSTSNTALQIIPASKIPVQQAFQDGKFNQK